MKYAIRAAWFATVTAVGASTALGQISISTTAIGNPGNRADSLVMNDGTSGYGGVAYSYNIGTHEVTNAQYAAFLNAKAASDPYNLYSTSMASGYGGITRSGADGSYTYQAIAGRENMPVNYVSFWDAARFANWLNNGQGNGDTETGAYTLTPEGISANTVTRNAGWQWAVTSEDEWYKAAYYQPAGQGGDADNYWLYPTQSNIAPAAGTFPAGQVNYNNVIGDFTDVGSYAANFYGVFDMAGNSYEWTEAIIDGVYRGLRGGSFNYFAYDLEASTRGGFIASHEMFFVGFRVSQIPGPSSIAVLAIVGLGAARRRRVRSLTRGSLAR